MRCTIGGCFRVNIVIIGWPRNASWVIFALRFILKANRIDPSCLNPISFQIVVFRCPLYLCPAVTAELSPYYVTNRLLYLCNPADYMWWIYVVHICLRVRHPHFSHVCNEIVLSGFVVWTKCFKRLDLYNYVWMRMVVRYAQSAANAVFIRFYCSYQVKIRLQNLQMSSRKRRTMYGTAGTVLCTGPLG